MKKNLLLFILMPYLAIFSLKAQKNEQRLFFEAFSYAGQQLPPNWQIQGLGEYNWGIYSSSYAGGQSPEMTFYFLPEFTGTSRLVTPDINLDNNRHLVFSFKHRISNFTYLFDNDVAAVEISVDGGQSWEELWTYVIETDLGPKPMRIRTTVPEGTQSARFAFKFSGESGNIMEWAIDNVELEKALANDLFAESLTGNVFPVAGDQTHFVATIVNEGSLTQQDYVVKLMNNLDQELATANGTSLEYGEKAPIDLFWTPGEDELDISGLYAVVELSGDELPDNNTSPLLNVHIQNSLTGISTVGDETSALGQFSGVPFDFNEINNLSQTIYFPEEMNVLGGMITGIVLYNKFEEQQQQPVELYMGLTNQDNLLHQFIPLTEQQLVFSGEVTFLQGENPVIIMLDEPFFYAGGENLIVSFYGLPNDALYPPPSRFKVSPTPDYPDRTRNYGESEVSFNWEDILLSGDTYSAVPNTTFLFDASQMGSLSGIISDQMGNPVENAKVTAESTGAVSWSNASGEYRFQRIDQGLQDINVKYKGYYDSQAQLQISQGINTIHDFSLNPLPVINIEGTVSTSDSPLVGLEGAVVEISGYDNKQVLTTTDGSFILEGVYGDVEYTLTISYPGYQVHQEQITAGTEELILGEFILKEDAHPAFNVYASLDSEQVKVEWEEAGSAFHKEFRYDDGVVDKMFGNWPSDFNSVYGAVHHNHAQIEEITWQLRHDPGSFPHEFVKLWIIGLNENGEPDPQQIVYTAENVPNTNRQWCSYELPTPVVMENGFFIGISANNHIGIGIDDGVGEPYEFKEKTQYFINDINTDPIFTPFESIFDGAFRVNFFIRAQGWDYGPVNFEKQQKQLESYNVYRLLSGQEEDDVDSWTLLAENHNSLEYFDQDWENLPAGEYIYAVIAEYTNQVYSNPSFSNMIPKDMQAQVGIMVETNSGDSPEGAVVTLTNRNGNPEYVYTEVCGDAGEVSFPPVWKGHYDLEISLGGFNPYIATELDITGTEFYHIAELSEIINDPYNLFVETFDVEPGQALFSWNNAFVGELMEGFEGSFLPEGWIKINAAGGTGWETISTGTSPIPGWEDGTAIAAPEGGETMAYMTYTMGGETDNDNWLVTPEVKAREGYVLSFYLRYWPENFTDNFQVLISSTDQDDPMAFDIVIENIEFGTGSSTDWVLYSYNLNDYVEPNTDIYIGFREYVKNNVDNGAIIMLDNVYVGPAEDNHLTALTESQVIKNTSVRDLNYIHVPQANQQRALQAYNVFLDDLNEPFAAGVEDTQFMFEDLTPGTYQAGVQSVYSTGLSQIITTEFHVPQLASVTFSIKDEEGLEVTDAVVTFEGETLGTGNYVIDGVQPGTYSYSISCEGFQPAEGEITVENTDVEITVVLNSDGTGLNENNLSEDILVYPNPSRDIFNIRSQSEINSVRLIDITGSVVKALYPSASECTINAGDLKPGIYLIQIVSGGKVSVDRIQLLK